MTRPACPVEGCDSTRDVAHVMCAPCWYLVPKTLRDEVWRTYRQYGPWADESVEVRETAIAFAERSLVEAAV